MTHHSHAHAPAEEREREQRAGARGRLGAVAPGHGHSHGLVDPSLVRSRAGVEAVALSLLVLGLTAAAQAAIFVLSDSVALLADLIHNVGDALTALPLGAAFFLRSARAERWAGLFVVLAIVVSACARSSCPASSASPPAS